MENRVLIQRISLISLVVLFILAIFMAYWLWIIYSKPSTAPESSYQPVKINQDQFSKLGIPNAYGTPVTAEEPGYGRVNPFSPYKPPVTPPTAGTATAGTATTSGTAAAPAATAQ